MGVINVAAVMLVLVYATNTSAMKDCPIDSLAVGSQSDVQVARQAFAKLTSKDEDGAEAETGQDLSANSVIDNAVAHFLNILKEQNMERIKIPSFEEKFSKKVGLVRATGLFRGENGWLDGITAISRKGEGQLRLDGTTILFESTAELDMVEVGMDYLARLKPISVKGKVKAKVHGMAATCSGGLKFTSGRCHLFLKTLEIKELGQINIAATGLGPLNWLYSKIVTWFTSRLRNDIKNSLESQLKELINNEMDELECIPQLTQNSKH